MVGNIQIKSGLFDYVLSFRTQLGQLLVFDSNAELSKRCLQIQYQISNLNLIVQGWTGPLSQAFFVRIRANSYEFVNFRNIS